MVLGLIKTMRPHQWVKNLFVLAPLIFAKELDDVPMLIRALLGLVSFCLLASAVYILNDLADAELDRAHPIKKNRPIASGKLSERNARIAGVVLVVTALGLGMVLGWAFAAAAFAYLVQNVAYSFGLKRVAYVDVLMIAAGFELRVLAGAFAAEVPPSVYLLVVTFLLALFLGLGKRMHELRQGDDAHKQRGVLRQYGERPLKVLLYVTGLSTVATYAVYTLDPVTRHTFGTNYLVVTTAFTLFGVLRFLHLVMRRPHAESPTEEMLKDKLFLANLVLWGVAVIAVIYTT
jgi:4-hydroxybenzoate polyprenyltransferase